MTAGCRRIVVAVFVLLVSAHVARAGEVIDLDLWHLDLAEALGEDSAEPEPQEPVLGLYPGIGVGLGLPNWGFLQANGYLSFSDGKRFSLFAGYGIERGPNADANMVTIGWGGVRRLPVASRQLGFHGKFLRYRHWDDRDHGSHHGISIGTESGVGNLALGFEVGAARSSRNHWLLVVQVVLKVTVPVRIPLAKKGPTPRD